MEFSEENLERMILDIMAQVDKEKKAIKPRSRQLLSLEIFDYFNMLLKEKPIGWKNEILHFFKYQKKNNFDQFEIAFRMLYDSGILDSLESKDIQDFVESTLLEIGYEYVESSSDSLDN